ncbi:MAG: minor capsid protein [Lachnospira pectinoschiza]
MMLGIGDVRDYIAGLGIADNDNVYCGKLDNKKDKSIGVYNLNRQRPPQTAVGGLNNSSYRIKSISILVHWNTSVRDTEKAAEQLYNMLRDTNNKIINDTKLLFTKMQVDGPVDVGTDDKGIFESVIELDIYYER